MHKSNTKAENKIIAELLRIFEECGPQTDADLLRRGYTQEEISTCGPKVARIIRERNLEAA